MAVYENKFEIGDEVFTKDNEHEYPRYTLMADLLFATNFCESLQQAKCKVVNYGLHPRNHDFIYLVEDENQHQHLFGEAGLELYNGQDKPKVEKPCKEVTKTGYVKCDKFTSICEYLTEGKVYSVKNNTQSILGIVNDMGNESLIPTVGQQDPHTGSVWQYTTEEEYLAQQSPKQQYKLRSKWVMNTGEKPDLPDGTVVKVKWSDGDIMEYKVEDADWYFSEKPVVNILKWKLADDWNEVVDGQAPDIDASTLVEVKNTKKYGGIKCKAPVRNIGWSRVKKWRYAKEKKAK